MHLHDDFTVITSSEHNKPGIAEDFQDIVGGRVADINISITKSLRARYKDLNVTQGKLPCNSLASHPRVYIDLSQPVLNVPLLSFASLGHATATLDTEAEDVFRARGWVTPYSREGQGSLVIAQSIFLALKAC